MSGECDDPKCETCAVLYGGHVHPDGRFHGVGTGTGPIAGPRKPLDELRERLLVPDLTLQEIAAEFDHFAAEHDIVEVVRCAECEFRPCTFAFGVWPADAYCSHGERRQP